MNLSFVIQRYLLSQIHSNDITKHEEALKCITNERSKYENLKECLKKKHLINVCDLTTEDGQMREVILNALKEGMS